MIENTSHTIKWTGPRDLHLEAVTELGPAWIRMNKQGKVTALYTRWFGQDDWDKHIPVDEDESSLEGMQTYAQLLLENTKFALKIANIAKPMV
jgi:hypothetical protein